jgi:hypothetical protein
LAVHLPEREALRSVEGWRGDRVQVYLDPGGADPILAGYTVFASDDSADDFFRAYRDLLGRKYDLDVFRRSDDTIFRVLPRGREREVYLERVGRRVLFLEGVQGDRTALVRRALWDVQRLRRSRPVAGGPPAQGLDSAGGAP